MRVLQGLYLASATGDGGDPKSKRTKPAVPFDEMELITSKMVDITAASVQLRERPLQGRVSLNDEAPIFILSGGEADDGTAQCG
ncbi:MAG: hypothetical protein ACRECE_13035, partial [Xanthobacteraceae bacterium]